MTERRVAIVTGASSGIGMETALALARRGYAVALAARRRERLEQLADRCRDAGGEPRVIVTDVADPGQVQGLVDRTAEEFGRVDVMVNNAGHGVFARVHETPPEQMREIFDVNFFGVFYGCRAVAAMMMRRRSGHIFNVSSVIGKRGTPFHGAYCATKFAVCGLSDSMRVEMRPYGVHVTAVCPALTATEFFEHSRRSRKAGSSFRRLKGLTPARVVGRKIAATVGKPVPELVFTAGGRLLALLSALWPRGVDALMGVYHNDLVKRLR
ncbi:MAG: SDR family NAD(P)-dependent oxidoreductase [Planctomycetota bacterium]